MAIKFEGTEDSIAQFDDFLVACFERGYYSEQLRRSPPSVVAFGGFLGRFTVLSDANGQFHEVLRPHGVVTGRDSGREFTSRSQVSTDGGLVHGYSDSGSRSSAGSRGSGDARSDGGSDTSSHRS